MICSFIIGCGPSAESDVTEEDESVVDESFYGYRDGTYCAEVDYYYSETGTSSTYTLNVDVEDNELVVIHWPNGGWLDDSHFEPVDISSGEASFTSDRGVDYTVRIMGEEGDCIVDYSALSEDDFVTEGEEAQQAERYRQEEEERIQQEDEEEDERLRQEEEEQERQQAEAEKEEGGEDE
jgi:predicted dehydrogenase